MEWLRSHDQPEAIVGTTPSIQHVGGLIRLQTLELKAVLAIFNPNMSRQQ
jgi:hypothetical protein